MGWTRMIRARFLRNILTTESSTTFRPSNGRAPTTALGACRTRSSTCGSTRPCNPARLALETINDYADLDPHPAPVLGRPCIPARLRRHDPAHAASLRRSFTRTHRWRYHETLPALTRARRRRR